jgi:hypothetical protein
MDNPLIREAVLSACSIIAQTASASDVLSTRLAAQKRAQDQEIRLWDARVNDVVVAFVDALDEDAISSDDWWKNVVFQQPISFHQRLPDDQRPLPRGGVL